MKVECDFCNIDELTLGFFMAYGEDEVGQFHMVTIGLLIFAINFITYIKNG